MKTTRGAWALAGLIAGLAGLATSYLLANLMSIRESPVVAIAEAIIRLTPGDIAESAIQAVGSKDKPILVVTILVVVSILFLIIGRLARRSTILPTVAYVVLALIAGAAVLTASGTKTTDALPVALGFITWMVALSVLTEPLRAAEKYDDSPAAAQGATTERSDASGLPGQTRRGFVLRVGLIAGVAVVAGSAGRLFGAGRRAVEETRRLLRLNGVTNAAVPPLAEIGVDGVSPWMTPAEEFYLIDTAIVKPAIQPQDWSLRIHGMVDKEIVLSYDDLVAREITEDWITLNCVSNPVGGPLIGNAWWSGVRLASILAEAGLDPEADAVLQTSEDGWSCATPISALTDDRNAILAIAMNGKPLLIEHGFPVRTVVPGLYGYVSATKWVVDMEVSRFDQVQGYWSDKGWSVDGPVKMSSRIEVPRYGDEVETGDVVFAGTAWNQHTGIDAVEVSIDGGSWTAAELSESPNDDCWVQWKATLAVEKGDHMVQVRATDKDGEVQTSVKQDVAPNGSSGWHTISVSASA